MTEELKEKMIQDAQSAMQLYSRSNIGDALTLTEIVEDYIDSLRSLRSCSVCGSEHVEQIDYHATPTGVCAPDGYQENRDGSVLLCQDCGAREELEP